MRSQGSNQNRRIPSPTRWHSSCAFLRMMNWRLLLLYAICGCFSISPLIAGVEWQVIKINGRDFLSIDNIAKFYGFPNPTINGRNIELNNGKNEMQFHVDSREMLINGVRNWLSFPVFVHDGKIVVSRIDLAKTLEPQLRPNMIKDLGRVQTVVLDPGHGGFDKGAISGYGYEKDYALDVARQLRPLLQAKGFRVMMTRESDVFVPLELRARIANATHNSIFVSLHFNATDHDPGATGFEIYSLTPRGAPSTYEDGLTLASINVQNGTEADAASVELSSCIYHSLLGHIGEFDRGIKRARFAVLRLTRLPAVLLEGGFLTERGESRLIANPEWRKKLAESICTGIENFRTLADTKKVPLVVADYRRQKPDSGSTAEKESPLNPTALAILSLDLLQAPVHFVPLQTPTPSPIGTAPVEP
ncbi:MAG: N-acetylmuramoyl-L-alanine amidase [Verrucomicrobia bacterium]|nr:MAG: N-acetylmuramoyl-L-alanine amidase [Verrucomicrobiota bacterium]